MNSNLLHAWTLGALLGAASLVPATAADNPSLLRLHSVGLTSMAAAAESNATREVAALPESRQLLDQTIARLARTPRALFGAGVPEAAQAASAPLLIPLLQDVVQREALLEVDGRDGEPSAWNLAVALSPERAALWRTNLASLARLWALPDPAGGTTEGLPSTELRLAGGWKARWVQGNGWFLLGAGNGSSAPVAAFARNLKSSGRPTNPLTDTWVTGHIDLGQLAKALSWPAGKPWPQVDFSLAGRADSLRNTGRIRFPEVVTAALPPWRIPTNTLTEPLIGFTAARGIAPLLSRLEVVSKLRLEPVPNEFYAASQDGSDSHVLAAFPLPDASNQLRRAAGRVREALPAWLQRIQMGEISWRTNENLLAWRGLPPIVTPTLAPITEGGREYAVLELFPRLHKSPPPASLIAQLQQPNLVYYDWELTQPRMQQWLHLSQLASVLIQEQQLSTNMVAFRWLRQAQPKLDNAVTEVTAVSPREWAFVRKSTIGLTSPELVAFARWLESTSFPKPGVTLPPGPEKRTSRRSAPPPPAASPK